MRPMNSALTRDEMMSGTRCSSHAMTSSGGGTRPRVTTTHAGDAASTVSMPSLRCSGWAVIRYSISVPPRVSRRSWCSCSW